MLSKSRQHLEVRCEICFATSQLEAHHNDRDRSNNERDNITTLCRDCHQYEHREMRRETKTRQMLGSIQQRLDYFLAQGIMTKQECDDYLRRFLNNKAYL